MAPVNEDDWQLAHIQSFQRSSGDAKTSAPMRSVALGHKEISPAFGCHRRSGFNLNTGQLRCQFSCKFHFDPFQSNTLEFDGKLHAWPFYRVEFGKGTFDRNEVSLSPVRRLDGAMIPSATITEIAALAKAHGTPMHLDGARLLLAPPSIDVKAYAAPFETVYVSLYKYLGAPFGAVLAGSATTIAKAREYRHLYGGLIYQGWAPAMLALDTLHGFAPLMARAHAAGEELIATLERSRKIRRRPNASPSNIHMLEMPRALAEAAFERGRVSGVRLGQWHDGAVPFL